MVSGKLSMHLVDPFFRCVQFALPDGSDGSLDHFLSFHDRPSADGIVYVEKFALSSTPAVDSNSSYSVAIVYGDCGKVVKVTRVRSRRDVGSRETN